MDITYIFLLFSLITHNAEIEINYINMYLYIYALLYPHVAYVIDFLTGLYSFSKVAHGYFKH